MSKWHTIIFWISIASSILLLLLTITETFLRDSFWLAALFVSLPHEPLLFAQCILLVAGIVKRSPVSIILNVLCLLFTLFVLCQFNVPVFKHGENGVPLTILSFNIHEAAFGCDAIRKSIEASKADVVCLQEVNKWNIEDSIFPGSRNDWHVAIDGDLAVLSRFPLAYHKCTKLPVPGSDRYALEAGIELPGRSLRVVNFHHTLLFHGLEFFRDPAMMKVTLERAMRIRRLETNVLIDMCRSTSGSLVLAGDFNGPPRDAQVRRLTSLYDDAFRRSGWGFGFTYSADLPVIRIDYILSSKDVVATRCFTLPNKSIDHKAIAACIIVK
jgi:endonuclease/exonuclease/phosphatase (EEP) superfamily protein YafD